MADSTPTHAEAAGGPSEGGATGGAHHASLSPQQIQSLLEGSGTADPVAQQRAMATMLLLSQDSNEQDAVLLDELYTLLAWGAENDFTSEQIALILGCTQSMLDAVMGSEDGWMDKEAAFEVFKAALLAGAVGPDGELVMAVSQLEAVTEHVSRAFFVRWRALQALFTNKPRTEVLEVHVSVDTPMPKPPLATAEVVEATVTGPAPGFEPPEAKEAESARSKGKRSPRGRGGRKK